MGVIHMYDADEKLENFKSVVADCLFSFQTIEEILRLTVKEFHRMIEEKIDESFPYNPSIQSIDNAAMGRLIEYFKVFTNNQELLQNLRELKAMRDKIAHRAFLYQSESFITPPDSSFEEVKEAEELSQWCFQYLVEEMDPYRKNV